MTYDVLIIGGGPGGSQAAYELAKRTKLYVVSGKYVRAEGGIARLCWLPKQLKEDLRDKINAAGATLGHENFADMIADETVSTDEMEILEWLTEKGHPAVTSMDPIM